MAIIRKHPVVTVVLFATCMFSIAAGFVSKPSFAPSSQSSRRTELRVPFESTAIQMCPAGGGDDPTKAWYAQLADGLQNALTNSPLNEGKKALARMVAGDYDKDIIRSKLDRLITEKPVLMLSFTTCPFCIKAKKILNDKGVSYDVVELDKENDGMALRAEMADVVGRTSVPAIWIGGKFIGGCNDGPMGGIVKLSETGELDSMLSGVGAI